MRIAVIGATGTAGSRTVSRLEGRGVEPVRISRSSGVDLITGDGLSAALEGVDVAIDASNPFPTDPGLTLHDAFTSATRNVAAACAAQRVAHLLFLSIAGIEHPALDGFPYYAAKRSQERIVTDSPVSSTVVKSTQWHEFSTSPTAVTFRDDEVLAEDWLIQPVAVDTVAGVLVEAALEATAATASTIAGPEAIRLPDLVGRLLRRRGDPRVVRATAPAVPALGEGVLLPPPHATVVGPDVDTWLRSLVVSSPTASTGARRFRAAAGTIGSARHATSENPTR